MKSPVFWFILFIVAASVESMAAIATSAVSISNASIVVLPSATTSSTSGESTVIENIKVYGGMSGESCTTTETANSTCNNCGDTPARLNTPCNRKRIDDSGSVTIVFTSNNANAFTAQSRIKVLNGTTVVNSTTINTLLEVNSPITIEILWSEICAQIGLSSCALPDGTHTTKTLKIGIDTNDDNTLEDSFSIDFFIAGNPDPTVHQYLHPCLINTTPTLDTYEGYCDVELLNGDQKVYLSNEAHGENFNRSPWGIKYKYLRVYYAEGTGLTCSNSDFSLVTSASPYQDFTFSEKSNGFYLDGAKVTSLSNDRLYYFRFANVDEAGNAYYFSGDSSSSEPFLDCSRHSAIPSEVVGLLDGKECFIATAAFGSSMAPELKTLRGFRDQVLKKFVFGRWLIEKYYSYSPDWAQWLREHQEMKGAVRALLRPITLAAQWALVYGIQTVLFLSMIGFLLGLFIVRRLVRRHE